MCLLQSVLRKDSVVDPISIWADSVDAECRMRNAFGLIFGAGGGNKNEYKKGKERIWKRGKK